MKTGVTGWVHLSADVLHLLATAGWVGAVFALSMLLFDQRASIDWERIERLDRALRDFASMGTVFVAVILLTGLANVWLIVGWSHLLALPGSDYGRLLLAKIALFLVMLCLAAANRFRLSPALGRARLHGHVGAALRALRVSLLLEISCALTILVIAAWLGTLAPTK
jgi:putative copper resistance protein D